jgi:hypothetical protein
MAVDFSNVALDVRFNAERTTIEITNFPTIHYGPVTLPPASPVGAGQEIYIDITMSDGGRGFYDKASGSISIALSLFLDVDRDWWFIHEDSKVPLTLSTEPPGSNLDNAGNIVLAGDGRVASDILNPLQHRRVTFICSGRITPHP